jgi:hypothetical protein
VVREKQVLSAEVELRQREDRPLQALPQGSGGVREEVLQQEHLTVLRQGRLLSKEPLVLREWRQDAMLPSRHEVCDTDHRWRHRRQARHGGDLLSAGPAEQQSEAVLPARAGRAQQPRLSHTTAGHQPVLLPAKHDL